MGKKINGRKRDLLVDTLGLLLAVVVTAANADDGTAAPRLLQRVDEDLLPRLSVIFGDNKYNNKSLQRWKELECPNRSILAISTTLSLHRMRKMQQPNPHL